MVLNARQQRVFEWLNADLGLPVFADVYKGAAIQISQRPAGYVSFVAHAGRDLMNGLASTVAGIQSQQVQYKQLVDRLQDVWQAEWGGDEGFSSESTENGHLIPIAVCKQISILIREHRSGRTRSMEADGLFFSTFLDYSDKDRIPDSFLGEWKDAKKWFLRHTHLRSDPFSPDTHTDLVRHFKCLDEYLYIAASSRHDRLQELNEVLDATNG